MFGYIEANTSLLSEEQLSRYRGCYCGLCRSLKERHGQLSRVTLSFDMTFLVMFLSSMYEPEESCGEGRCGIHPLKKRAYWSSRFTHYAADMNVALAYHNCLDDWADDRNALRYAQAKALRGRYERIAEIWPRQCGAIERCISDLSAIEKSGCDDPDAAANCFGELMGQLFVCREDLWQEELFGMGMALGRFVYLTDAAVDYRADVRRGKYNPFAAMGQGEDDGRWEEYLVLAMANCTRHYERLPLVQDKALLDNILYSGVWGNYRRKKKHQEEDHDR